MQTVIKFPDERWRKPKLSDDPSAELVKLAIKIAQLAQQPIATKENAQQSISTIALSIKGVRQFVSLIPDDATRTRLFDQMARIEALVEVARQKAELL